MGNLKDAARTGARPADGSRPGRPLLQAFCLQYDNVWHRFQE